MRGKSFILNLSFVSLLFACDAVVHAQWAQWGGPTRDFKSTDSGLLDSWPDAGPDHLWTAEYGGNYATVIVDENVAYTLGYHEKNQEEMVVAISIPTGALKWYFRYPAPPDKSCRLDFGKGPNATPLVRDDKIISVGFSGHVWCLEKDLGDFVWTHDLVKEFGAKVHTFGYSISPILHGDNVIIGAGGDKQGVIAFKISSGDVAWKSEPVDVSYASPILIEVDGQTQLVMMATTEVVGLNPVDGKILWRHPHENVNRSNCALPVWGKDNVLFVSSHGDGGGARALNLRQKDGKTSVKELWYKPKVKFFHSAPIRIDDHVYGSIGTSSPTFLSAVSVKTGEIAWRERGYNKATCTYADGKMYLLDEDGRMTLARVSPEKLTAISSFKPLESRAWATPTIANKTLFVRDQKKIRAFSLTKP